MKHVIHVCYIIEKIIWPLLLICRESYSGSSKSKESLNLKPDEVALTEEPWDSTLEEARSKQDEARLLMMNRNEELRNEALMSKQDAERAMNENESLKKQIEEEKAENSKLKEADGKSKQEIQDLKSKIEEMETENEKLKKQVKDSVEVVNLYG